LLTVQTSDWRISKGMVSASDPGCVKTLLRITWNSFPARDVYIAISGDQCGPRDVCHRICNSIRKWRKGDEDLAEVAWKDGK